MKSLFAALVLAALTAPLTAAPALALNWRVAPAESRIEFRYQEDGEAAAGRFTEIEGLAEFDAARPERARLTLTIEIDGIRLSDGFRSDFVKTETWFDAERFPTARFTLEQIALAPGQDRPKSGETARYAVNGVLTIKGESRPIATEIDLTLDPRKARAVGELRFNRLDFEVGDTIAGFFVEIGPEVAVAFDITAKRI